MNFLLETFLEHGFILDVFGVIGIGLIGLAAIRLAARHGCRHTHLMTWGALALIFGRIGMLIFSHFVNPFNAAEFDPVLLAVGKNVPLFLLTAGLGAIVLGFWNHERMEADLDL